MEEKSLDMKEKSIDIEEEYFVDVDLEDNILHNVSKQEIYEKKHMHRIVHVLIFNKNNEMLLQLRVNVSYCPFYWSTSVGGHVQAGETCETAALREYQEELGVQSNLELFSKDFFKGNGGPDKFLYTFRTVFDGPFKIDKKAVEKVEFFSLEKIKEMIRSGEKIHPELLFILEKHFGIKGS